MTIIFLTIYSMITTIFIVFIFFLNRKSINTHDDLSKEINNIEDIQKKITLLSKIQEYKNNESPWYEKLISTLGVLAFITMSITTLNQTYESAKSETKLINIKNDIKRFSEKKDTFDRYIKNTVEYILDKNNESLIPTKKETYILKIRLEELISSNTLTTAFAREAFAIAILIKDYVAIQNIYSDFENELLSGNIYTQLHLAEYYYIRRNTILTNRILNNIDENQIPVPGSVRFYTLMWSLNNESNKYILSLSKKQGIDKNLARRKITDYYELLKDEQKKFN